MPSKEQLYIILATLFSVVVIVSNFITPKMLELGNLALPAGLLTYPLTFLLGDLVTELYGRKSGQFMVFLGFTMSLIACLLVQMALLLPPSQAAFMEVFGQNPTIVFASMVGFIVAQLADVNLYALVRRLTGDRLLWLRSNVSTLLSQALDTLLVTSLTFAWGFGYEWSYVLPLILFSYMYKALFSIAMTPLYYLLVRLAKKSIIPADSQI